MALIKCPECGKEISDKARACPNCGYPIAKLNDKDSIPQNDNYLMSSQQHNDALTDSAYFKANVCGLDANKEQCRNRQKVSGKTRGRKVIYMVLCLAITAITSFFFDIPVMSKTVELSTSNFSDYFEVSCSYGELEHYSKMGITFAWVEMMVDIYPVCAGTLDNVDVTLKITPPIGWSLSSKDSAYTSANKETAEFFIRIRIPASGEYRETHRLGALMTTSKPYSDCEVQVISVAGTFEKK